MFRQHSEVEASLEKQNVLTPLTAAVLSALYPASQVVAQEEEDDGLGLEEVVVTATRRTMSIQDVPQSIIAFSTQEIERRGMLDAGYNPEELLFCDPFERETARRVYLSSVRAAQGPRPRFAFLASS